MRLRFAYEITGRFRICRTREVREPGIVTAAELMKMFQATGLQVDYDSKGPSNRGS